MFLDTDRQMAHTWLLVYISIRIFPQSAFLFYFFFFKENACLCMHKDVWTCRFFQRIILCLAMLFYFRVLFFPFNLEIVSFSSFSWYEEKPMQHLSPTKLFISCSLNNTDETEGGQNTSSKDTSHIHTSSAIQKEAIHLKYVVNTFESSLLSMLVVISV